LKGWESALKREVKENASGSQGDPLKILGVLQRLEVGPVQIEKRRLIAPYTVTQNGNMDSTELIYRFEEDVFTPGEPESLNLASMISAQVALNYGLFCDEMVFHGWFEDTDQRFLQGMAENTAREIFMKKFLEPNPFVRGPVTELSPVKRKAYSRSQMIFHQQGPEAEKRTQRNRNKKMGWALDPSRHAILSSGGKDSLLSFGLLRETGYEVHPIFINESGRHWFTALNAYRHFSANIPHTARVWTNSDRLFSWMLRHIPFVRQDFENIRSDEYPIRLWTVAVFLFGALPILRKRGIGRLVIGDEFDTTQRLSRHGITHYDGLYDQSRYFDNALTRYFRRKGWDISQFSVLRPLSELLIEKILVERYPELQRHQVSCHATHKENESVRPCGRCEKCRRIVGMLTALGSDPGNCGYTQEQMTHCLKNLLTKGIHQENEGIEHLAYLLEQKGIIDKPSLGSVRGRQRPEILKLRFDPEKSPVEGIPVDLREPLYRIYLEHAEGMALRKGRGWIDFDVFVDPALRRPYPFHAPKALKSAKSADKDLRESRSPYLLRELTWPEAQSRFKEVDVALLPVGSIEQHGPHLPLDCDSFDAEYLAEKVAEKCMDPKPLVLPLIPYGVSYHHEDFSGTISISPETLSKLVYDIGMSATRHGVTKLVIINGHGGNSPALHFAAQMINRDAHIFTCVDTGETSDPDVYGMAETPNDVHAGEIETSTTLATRPDLVRMDTAKKFVPKFSSRYLNFTSKRRVEWYAHTSKISQTGVMGDPTKGDAEKGERMWDIMIKRLVEFVEDLKNLSLDEIYQKRY
jgi:creatinine amidohydrolase/Fe(II)-dependent formamide hydrolase-like protein/7-cyano-7-deazaguanine synthase in queuosine biosynthesis